MTFGGSIYAQSLSPQQQEIIERQRAEIRQKRNTADKYLKQADDAKERCEALRNANKGVSAQEGGKAGFTIRVEMECDKVKEYQNKADKLMKEADEQERLLNAAIEKAKKNAKKTN